MSSGPIELASTVVSIGISTKDAGKQILKDTAGIGAAFGKVGQQGGSAFSSAFSKSAAGATKGAVADQAALEKAVQSAVGKVKSARDAEAAAARKVAIEETKLKEARGSGAKESQILAIEDRLAGARTKQALATSKTTIEVDKLKGAQRELKSASEQAEQGVTKSAGRLRTAFDKINPFAGMKAKAKKEGEDAGDEFGSSMEQAAKKGQGRLGKAGVAIGTAVGGGLLQVANKVGGAFVDTVTGSISGASNLEQSIGGIGAVFGKDVDQIDKAARGAATSIGMSRNAYNELATTVGAGLKNKGIKDYAGETQRLLGLGGDLAAQFGGSTQEAVEALSSLMRGESDPIERYGVSINETAVNAELAARGQDKLTGAALESAKAQARLDLVFRQTADAQGAFARESNTFAGVQARASAQWEDLQAKIGTAFLPVLTQAMGFVSSKALPALDGLGKGIQGVWSILSRHDFIGLDFTFGLDEDSPVVSVLLRINEGFQRLRDAMTPLAAAGRDLWATFQPLVVGLAKLAIGAALGAWEGFTRAVAALTPILAAVAGWMRGNDVLVRSLAVAVIGGVAAFKAYQLIILAVAKAKVIWAAAQKALNVVLKANPIGLVVTALMALGAGLVYAYKNSETFRNIVNGVWAGIRTVVGAVVAWFVNVVAPFFVGLWDTLSSGADGAATGMASAWQGVKDFFSGLWEGVKAVFSTALDFLAGLFLNFTPLGLIIQHWEPIVGFFSGLWARVSGAFMAGLNAIWGVVGPWVQWFMGVFKAAWGVLEFLIVLPIRLAQIAVMAAWDLIRGAFQAAWNWVSGTFMGWWRTIAPLIDGVMSTVRGGIDTAWKWITDRFAQAWAWISGPFMAGYRLLSGLIDAVMTAVRNGINVAWQWIQDRFQQAWAWVSGTFMGWWRQLTGLIDGVFTLVRNAIGAGWQWIQDRFSQAWTWVSGTFMGWWRTLTGLMETPIRLAREGIDTVLDGIKSGFERAVEFVRTTWDKIKGIVRTPVEVAIKVGNALISGFRTVAKAVGLDDIAGKLVDIPPLPAFAGGGRPNIVPGSRSRGVDSTLAVTGRGVPIARVDPGEGIVRYGAMRSLDRFHPGAFDYINKHGMLPGFFQGGRLPTPGPVRPHGLPYYGARYAADMGLGTGSPVYAWNPGTVSQTMLASTSYGNRVRINHDGGLGQTLYAHLSRILVAAGDVVSAGQKIGEVGYSGNVRPAGPGGAHLHFEILGGNAPISASGAAQGESSGFFDWVGDLAGKFAGPLKELAGIGSSPVAEIVKAIPKMVADGMLGKVKGAATSLMDSVGNFGANVATTAMSGTTLLPQMFAIAKSWGLDRRIAHIMGITMMQEASGRLDFTPDSNSDVGPFQQRTPRDGTIEQLNNLEYAMRTFLYGTTARPGNGDRGGYHVPGLFDKRWQSMGLGQAAQAVQVSAFPSYYDKHIPLVDRMLTGFGYWRGTDSATPGWHLVGERGPELVNFRGGEQVLSNTDSAAALANQFPRELVVVDADGALVGRMRVEAQSALADSYARVGGR